MTVDSPIIRSFQEEDCEPVVRLASDLGLSPWTLNDYLDELKRPDSEMIVAQGSSQLAGFIVGRRVPGTATGEGVDAEIYNIGVVSESQRSGVGTGLILGFIERCRLAAVRNIWLEVRAANTAAIEFYRNFGFIEYGARPNFYQNPLDDGIVMKLSLDPGPC